MDPCIGSRTASSNQRSSDRNFEWAAKGHEPRLLDSSDFHANETQASIHGDNAVDAFPTSSVRQDPTEDLDAIENILSILKLIQNECRSSDTGEEREQYAGCEELCKSEKPGEIVYEEVPHHEGKQLFLHVTMPQSPPGRITFEYEMALRNRIKYPKLSKSGEYDTRSFTPTFIHDCLMLPGTLAKLTGKRSPLDLIRRMTPALLPGYHAHVHPQTQLPCLLQSTDLEDYAQGMVVFGQGREARNLIHEHYRPHAKRVKLHIEVEFTVLHPSVNTWQLGRKTIWANAWLWSDPSTACVQLEIPARWTIEDYLAGTLINPQFMWVGYGGFIGYDYEGDSTDDSGKYTDGQMTGWEPAVQDDNDARLDVDHDGCERFKDGTMEGRDVDWIW